MCCQRVYDAFDYKLRVPLVTLMHHLCCGDVMVAAEAQANSKVTLGTRTLICHRGGHMHPPPHMTYSNVRHEDLNHCMLLMCC